MVSVSEPIITRSVQYQVTTLGKLFTHHSLLVQSPSLLALPTGIQWFHGRGAGDGHLPLNFRMSTNFLKILFLFENYSQTRYCSNEHRVCPMHRDS